ncbi:conserved hypothetical protein [Leishmania major strain Friedlin]|uniref:Uncharacterized protein n=1 Tax=Leishmania major TaxID=5664 RepID=Q4QE52_LEIMA|nr:conserved hypothetical protein [Leishmania major strain Friedlin]CAG9572372.1 hypothetical_protein_-_conserved [Leishmania major strain Friedlin]CAJ04133.1 conserved hypothetical protein [Leishmania major strain Friedlin]|eukprot:XP_001682396.1 conserved hypothetical protein [Leishmania major strain Friedlin]
MSVQAFEFSSSILSPKYVGLSPFRAPKESRLDTSPPGVLSSMCEYTMCAKRALNTRIIGFAEPTLQQCIEEFARALKASTFIQDKDATSALLRQRRGTVDPSQLPWSPRPEYLAWLRAQGRLEETVSL